MFCVSRYRTRAAGYVGSVFHSIALHRKHHMIIHSKPFQNTFYQDDSQPNG